MIASKKGIWSGNKDYIRELKLINQNELEIRKLNRQLKGQENQDPLFEMEEIDNEKLACKFFITRNGNRDDRNQLAFISQENLASQRFQRIRQQMIERYEAPFLISDLREEPFLSYLNQLEKISFDEIDNQFKRIEINSLIENDIESILKEENLPKDENLKALAIEKRLGFALEARNFEIAMSEGTKFEGEKIQKVLENIKKSTGEQKNFLNLEIENFEASFQNQISEIEELTSAGIDGKISFSING